MEVTQGTGPGSLGSRGSKSPWANARSHHTMAKSIQEQRNAEVKMRRECCHFKSTIVVKTSWRNRPWEEKIIHYIYYPFIYSLYLHLFIYCIDRIAPVHVYFCGQRYTTHSWWWSVPAGTSAGCDWVVWHPQRVVLTGIRRVEGLCGPTFW